MAGGDGRCRARGAARPARWARHGAGGQLRPCMMGPLESCCCARRACSTRSTIRLGADARSCAATATPGATNGPSSMRRSVPRSAAGLRARLRRRLDARRSRTIRISPAANWWRFCKLGGASVGIVFDTGNTFPVGEAPLDFTRVIAPYVRHVHLKDYRVQFTDEGFRLVRCAIGDGAVPFRDWPRSLPSTTAR